jgi:hypothetical protein
VVPEAIRFRAWTPEEVVAECLVGSNIVMQNPASRSWHLWRYCIAGDKERSDIAESTERRDVGACSSGKMCEELENIVAYCVICESSWAFSCLLCRLYLDITDFVLEVLSVHSKFMLL